MKGIGGQDITVDYHKNLQRLSDKVGKHVLAGMEAQIKAAADFAEAAEAKKAEANKSYTEKVMSKVGCRIDTASPEDWDASWKAMYADSYNSMVEGGKKASYFNTPKHTTTKDKQVGGSHYTKMTIQPREYILANQMGYDEANVVKYVSRHQDKGGAQDIKKAIQYLEFILEDQYNGNN
jgi:hypothetical protein